MMSVFGIVMALIASMVWGATPAIVTAYAREAPSIPFNAVRVLASLPLLIAIEILRVGESSIVLTPLSVMLFVSAALLGPGLGDVAYIRSIQLIGANRAVMISYTYIFVAQIIAATLIHERYTMWMLLGSLTAFSGIVLAFYRGGARLDSRGVVYGVVAAFSWGLGSVINKLALSFADPLTLACVRMLILLIVLSSVARRSVVVVIRERMWLLSSVITGVLAYGVGLPLFLYALNIVGISMTVLITALVPMFTALLSKIIAGEGMGVRVLLGLSMVSMGIAISSMG